MPQQQPKPAARARRQRQSSRRREVGGFARLYYYSRERTWSDTRWLGVPALKFDKSSKGAEAYIALAGEMLNRSTEAAS